ncbi:MAG: hypothetical protein ACI8Y7_000194 [Candidatus Woesearchaeota archaeon]|jgi:hypothetical protein
MKKILLLVLSVLVMSACASLSGPALFADLIEKGETAEYKAVYSLDLGPLGAFFGSEPKMGIYKSGVNEKAAVEINILGQNMVSTTYKLGDNSYTCQKLEGETSCSKGGEEESDLLQSDELRKAYDEGSLTITQNADEVINDITCKSFTLELDDVSKLDLEDFIQEGSVLIDVCLEPATGAMIKMAYTTEVLSELTEEMEEQQILALTALSFTSTVEASEFELPVRTFINAAVCGEELIVKAESLDATQEISITFTDWSDEVVATESAPLTFDGETTYDTLVPEDAASATICFGESCTTEYCSSTTNTQCIQLSDSECATSSECFLEEGVCSEFSCFLDVDDKETCDVNAQCAWDEDLEWCQDA